MQMGLRSASGAPEEPESEYDQDDQGDPGRVELDRLLAPDLVDVGGHLGRYRIWPAQRLGRQWTLI